MNDQPSRLGRLVAPAAVVSTSAAVAVSAPPSSRLAVVLATRRRGDFIEIPGVGRVWLELATAGDYLEIQAATRRAMAAAAIPDELAYLQAWELERAVLTLERTIREPEEGRHATRVGSRDEWAGLDIDTLNAAWNLYGDVRERLDPMSIDLAPEDQLAIELAIKKKDGALLRSFGATRLSAYLTTSDGLLSSSQTPSS